MTEAWVTLATNDDYSRGALVLGHSLKEVGTKKKLHCMTTTQVSPAVRAQLEAVFDTVSDVEVLNSKDHERLALNGRPELGVTFTKLRCWRLTQYTKAVFLDTDTLADDLFDISAAAGLRWPDYFNSGVFIYTPCIETYTALLEAALSSGSFDGGDQGLLNDYFLPTMHGLPFIYNMSSNAPYTYPAAYKKHEDDIRIVHFVGPCKPWTQRSSGHQDEHLLQWHRLYASKVAEHIGDLDFVKEDDETAKEDSRKRRQPSSPSESAIKKACGLYSADSSCCPIVPQLNVAVPAKSISSDAIESISEQHLGNPETQRSCRLDSEAARQTGGCNTTAAFVEDHVDLDEEETSKSDSASSGGEQQQTEAFVTGYRPRINVKPNLDIEEPPQEEQPPPASPDRPAIFNIPIKVSPVGSPAGDTEETPELIILESPQREQPPSASPERPTNNLTPKQSSSSSSYAPRSPAISKIPLPDPAAVYNQWGGSIPYAHQSGRQSTSRHSSRDGSRRDAGSDSDSRGSGSYKGGNGSRKSSNSNSSRKDSRRQNDDRGSRHHNGGRRSADRQTRCSDF